jgi:hypothetical protein
MIQYEYTGTYNILHNNSTRRHIRVSLRSRNCFEKPRNPITNQIYGYPVLTHRTMKPGWTRGTRYKPVFFFHVRSGRSVGYIIERAESDTTHTYTHARYLGSRRDTPDRHHTATTTTATSALPDSERMTHRTMIANRDRIAIRRPYGGTHRYFVYQIRRTE